MRLGSPPAFAELELLGSDRFEGLRLWFGDPRRVRNVPLDQSPRVNRAELLVQELQLLFELAADRGSCGLRERPHLLLERSPDLLPRFVDELLLRIALSPLTCELL